MKTDTLEFDKAVKDMAAKLRKSDPDFDKHSYFTAEFAAKCMLDPALMDFTKNIAIPVIKQVNKEKK